MNMYYVPLIIVLVLIVLYFIGNIHCSFKMYDELKDEQKVYVCLNSSRKYEAMKVHVDNDGHKYVISKDGTPQFRITLWDIVGMVVIDENEYDEMM